ncbi:hypothetical protein MYSTI_05742 [Myxococcus stipitatus DSM 14675]|uniref:FHA domain-containing protein n=1 Tax=Myxococcus stipitatus (strain DSM 14675 / JCM 12634 / Mx s8) TaxID=1278073 RepID=L7UG65_MYXSD|nr:FHA domain-containing protein [Myxococcus stipitatus]AGC47018.1 hypothetical protein MYSTI_05742 [Myxococcus stipitatus DSM 14675]
MAAVILEARCVAPFAVDLRFSDGRAGEVDLSAFLFEYEWNKKRTPDLSIQTRDWLSVPENFETLRVHPESGTLAWGDERPFPAELLYWRVVMGRILATVSAKDGTLLGTVELGGTRQTWSRPVTLGRASTNRIVVDREGVAPVHAQVTVGGGHHPRYFIEVVEGETRAGGTCSSTPGERWSVSALQPLLLELGDCVVKIGK